MSEAPVAKVANNFLKSFGSRYWKYDIARTKKNVVYMRNLGIIKANSLKCRYIFHLDSDVHLKPNSISNLVKILQEDDGIFSACQEFLVPLKDEGFIFGTKRKYANFSTLDKRELVDVENVAMGATLFRLALLNKVGLLDERVPMIEDLNIHKKARNLGYRVVFDKRDPLFHDHKHTTWEDVKKAYFSGKEELYNMKVSGTWRSELRSSTYWLLLILSFPFILVTPLPFLSLLIIGFARYFLIARGLGRVLLFPAMFLSKVPRTLGLLRASLSKE